MELKIDKYKARLVMTVELSFDLEATSLAQAEALINMHEVIILADDWKAKQAHEQIKNMRETLYMSKSYVSKAGGLVLG